MRIDEIVRHLVDGEPRKASTLAMQMLEDAPENAKLWDLLGVSHLQLADYVEAGKALKRACNLDPQDAEAWDHFGVAWMRQSRHAEAFACFKNATMLAPDREAYWVNAVANALHAGWPHVAEECATRAAALPQASAGALSLMARQLAQLGLLNPSIALYRQVLAMNDLAGAARALAWTELGHVHGMAGHIADASAAFRAAIAIDPARADAHSPLLFSLMHDEQTTPEQLFAEHLTFGERFEQPLRAQWQAHTNDRDPQRRLRVGFVSGDLCFHSVANFIEPVWRAMDQSQFELWVYSNNAQEDAVTRRLRTLVPNWRKVFGVGDAELTAQIRADGIDILVDLSGHTLLNRMLTFARKPAPVQAAWIGYPGTTGLAAIDYSICDRFNAPPGRYEHFYTEKFVRLPSASLFQPSADAPDVAPLPALSTGTVTFGSFNRPGKLGDAVIDAFSRILLQVPQSTLLLCPVSDPALMQQLHDRFARHGVGPERLAFQPRQSLPAYLALHDKVDILLDSWPYAGGTTNNHAVWMGVPVVTLRGPSRAHCQGAAVMGRMELDDWVADDVDSYVQIAVTKAGDLPALAALRAGMRERSLHSPWRRAETVARGLEAGLRQMWRRWCEGDAPAHMDVRMDDAAPVAVPVPVLKPDMPTARQLLPWLEQIDANGQYTNFGPLVRRFESTLADSLAISGMPANAVATSSGTAAIELGIAAMNLPRGALVLMPSYTFAAAAGVVRRLGLEPVFADIDALSWQLTPHIARAAAKKLPLALVLPASTFGCTVDVAGWDAFIADTGIPVLIDAAAAFGNQQIGQAAAVAFSFHATKPFGIGEGGALLTRNGALATQVRRLSNFGYANSVSHVAGTNAKMSEYAAAVGLAQLERWPERQRRRKTLWDAYSAALAQVPRVLIQQGFGHTGLPAAAVLRLPVAADLAAAQLAGAGIETRRWYYPLLHQHPAFATCKQLGPMGDAQLMNSEFLATHALGLPWFGGMTEAQCERVVKALHDIVPPLADNAQ